MAAAVADFRPARSFTGKLKKDAAQELLRVDLERTPDILAGLAARRRDDQTIVGFAAEHGEGALEHGRDKLARKRLDAVVVNDVAEPGIGFDAADNEVTIVTAAQERRVPRATKAEVAAAILDAVLSHRSSTTLRV
jgi:phosphopantothenoylcysteine decarboxylase/phosphopantothenate--cysteine ligase